MDPDAAIQALLAHARSDDGKWPLTAERPILDAINTWVAIRESDKAQLKRAHGWTDTRRPYRVDPLGERIADAWAHYLWGEEPRVKAANDGDATLLDDLLPADFASELERAATLCVSEGEIWARIYADPLVAPRPLLDWVSRRNVLPLWVGPRLAAAAVVTEFPGPYRQLVYRHMECHAPGLVVNVLWRGGPDKLGTLVDLTTAERTAELEPEWRHGLPGLLVERIPNRLRGRRDIGLSDYAGILDYLLDLNETAIIGGVNMRLTARKRAVITAGVASQMDTRATRNDLALTPEENQGAGRRVPEFDVAEDILVEDPLDTELGKAGSSPYRILEYSFDAEPLIAWKRDLVETALSRVGLSAQYAGLGAGQDGYAISGTALRLRLIPTDKTGRGKARYWVGRDGALPRILGRMIGLDSLPTEAGGFGRQWGSLDPPTVDRPAGLPEDETEEATRHQGLVAAGLESRETAIRALHPEWEDSDVKEELARLDADRPPAPTSGPGFMTGLP